MKNYPIKIETGEHAGETVWIHPVQIPKNQMGIAVKELKAKYPAADGKKIADLVKANLCN